MRAFYKNLVSQTFAIWLIQLALVILPAIDAYFLSGINSQNIAGYAIGNAFYSWWVLAGKGVLQGITFAIAPLHGKGEYQSVVNLLIQALWLVGVLTGVAWLALMVSGMGISQLAISDELRQLAVQYLKVAAFGLPAIFGVRVLAAWLEGISKPASIAIWFWSAMLLKVGLTWALLNGVFGNQWQNTTGTALSTNIFYWVIFLGLLGVTWYRLPKLFNFQSKTHNLNTYRWLPDFDLLVTTLKYGLPIAAAYLMEFALFPAITSLLAVVDEQALAAYEILTTVYDLVLSLPIAFMLAFSIWVGQRHEQYPNEVKQRSQWAEWLMLVMVVIIAGGAWLFHRNWLGHYTQDSLLIGYIVASLPLFFMRALVESVQSLMAFNLRAIDKGWYAVIISSLCLWGISLGGIWWAKEASWLTTEVVWGWLGMGYGVGWLWLRWGFYQKIKLRRKLLSIFMNHISYTKVTKTEWW